MTWLWPWQRRRVDLVRRRLAPRGYDTQGGTARFPKGMTTLSVTVSAPLKEPSIRRLTTSPRLGWAYLLRSTSFLVTRPPSEAHRDDEFTWEVTEQL